MKNLFYTDRTDGQKKQEEVPCKEWITLLYSKKRSYPLLCLIARWSLVSAVFGWLARRSFSKKHIASFIKHYQIDITEFKDSVASFSSFNHFFIRKLKPRNIHKSPVVLPADGRHFFFSSIRDQQFILKEQPFDLKKLLSNPTLYQEFKDGHMLISRLAPVDYHRFHFPTDATIRSVDTIPGALYSVHPLALLCRLQNYWENKRIVTLLESPHVGRYVMVEIGATHVGSIVHTTSVGQNVKKGDEKGYFSFGGSCVVTVFLPGVLQVDADIVQANTQGLEIKASYGDSFAEIASSHNK